MKIPNGLSKEAWKINNPALGSYMLWICAIEIFKETKQPVHPSKLFCVFAFIFYSDTREVLAKTRGTLQGFLSKLSSKEICAGDIVLSIHSRVDEQKVRTLDSLIVAFDSGLLIIDTETGLITPNLNPKPIPRTQLEDTLRELFDCSRRLGIWFSNLTTQELTRIIKVVF